MSIHDFRFGNFHMLVSGWMPIQHANSNSSNVHTHNDGNTNPIAIANVSTHNNGNTNHIAIANAASDPGLAV